jgi:murein DD-endopeptidase MepM/ murein hydrolase activator NlpD
MTKRTLVDRTANPPLLRNPGLTAVASVAGVLAVSWIIGSDPAHSSRQALMPAQFAHTSDRPAPPPPLRYELQLPVVVQAGESVEKLLARAGVATADAYGAARALQSDTAVPQGTEIALFLGRRLDSGTRELRALKLRPQFGLTLELVRDGRNQWRLGRYETPIDATPQRYSGRVGDDLFWSLRAAGVPADAARLFFTKVSERLASAPRPDDRFSLVLDFRRSENGDAQAGPILYANLQRSSGQMEQFVRWTVGEKTDLFDPRHRTQATDGVRWPVSAQITSGFGLRRHPILGFARMHRGIDFGAAWGTPVRAAEDGAVVAAGWNGGYGRQVRLHHSERLETSYSHLSELAISAGDRVHKGQVIGYVGSSGLSTGPHLHFEAHRSGNAIDPRSLEFTSPALLGPNDLAAMAARVRQLQNI